MTNTPSTLRKPLAALLGLILACAACGSSSSDADPTPADETETETAISEAEGESSSETTEETGTEETGTEETGTEFVTLTDVDPDDNIGLFSADGADDFAFTVSSCVGEGESTVSFEGVSEGGTSIAVEATDMIGGIFVDGPEGSYEGSVASVIVGDTGWTTVSGEASVADHTDTTGPLGYTVSGFVCK